MEGAQRYFDKRTIMPALIEDPVAPDISGIITIPAFGEGSLLQTLESLAACEKPEGQFEVIVLINHPVSASSDVKALNEEAYAHAVNWAAASQGFKNRCVFILKAFDVEDKYAGVGTARKIIMDEAARRLVSAGLEDKPIVGLDADCLVEANYFRAIEAYFESHPDICGCSIRFTHRTKGLPELQRKAITGYEQHLRAFIGMQRKIGFPFAYQTIGSAMAVRCRDYIRQGGMNRRKAGEDFYFLHKFIELGCFGELNDTCVYPSGRVSDRVPFGTGKAVGDALVNNGDVFTYNPRSYQDLKMLFDQVEALWKMDLETLEQFVKSLPRAVGEFLQTMDYQLNIADIQSHTSSKDAFVKRFFRWFNAFQLMKYLHDARDHFYPDVPVDQLNWDESFDGCLDSGN